MGAGVAAVVGLVDPNLASYQEGLTNTIDRDGTSDSAVIGEQIGALEVQAGEGAGNLVPSNDNALIGSGKTGNLGGAGSAASGPGSASAPAPAPKKSAGH